MANAKTSTNPKGGGRTKGKVYPNAIIYPGILGEIRFKYTQMKAQAKFRGEEFVLTWQEFQDKWQGKWHLRGRESNSLCMTRLDWDGAWDNDNTIIVERIEHLRIQTQHRVAARGR
jgi:hypothetical protein